MRESASAMTLKGAKAEAGGGQAEGLADVAGSMRAARYARAVGVPPENPLEDGRKEHHR